MACNKIFGVFCIICLVLMASLALVEAQPLTYENETLGVKLTGPDGWSRTTGPYKNEKAKNLLVSFHHSLNKKYSPFIILTVEPAKSRTSLDYANLDIEVLKNDHKDLKIIKEPTSLTINGREGINFTYEYMLKEGVPARYSISVFMKGELFYILACGANPEDFENNLKSFDPSVNTLMLK